MAEKYGTIPPKFTKAWWSYFWDYYKWYVIAAVLIMSFIIYAVTTEVKTPNYDMTVIYTGEKAFEEEALTAMQKKFEEYSTDANGDDEVNVQVVTYGRTLEEGREMEDFGSKVNFDASFEEDCKFLYLIDKKWLDIMFAPGNIDNVLVPVSEWGVDTPGDAQTAYCENIPYAVSLKDSKIMQELGIDCDDVYVMLRINKETDEINTRAYESALSLVRELVK